MKRLSLITAVAGTIAGTVYVTTISATAQAPTPLPSIWLQPGSPGTLQTGNANISGKVRATQFEAAYNGTSAAILAEATQTTGFAVGVAASSESNEGAGVYSVANSSTGTATGVFGQSSSVDGHGVWGMAGAFSGTNYGVRGSSNSSGGYGVYGTSPGVAVHGRTTDSNGVGVLGWCQGADSIAVQAQGDGAGSIGVYSLATGAAGVFFGGSTGVSCDGNNYGIYAASGLGGYAVYARNTGASGSAVGLYATSDSPDGMGIQANVDCLFSGAPTAISATATGIAGGNPIAISATATSPFGTPIAIDANSNSYYAIRAKSTSHHGIFSETTGGGGIVGVWGQGITPGATGLAGRGVTGVYGVTTVGGGNAGHFDGNLYAVSSSASVKAFVIDHPLDPENKYLYHSCVESNQRINTYKGRVTLDDNGEAWVPLPTYFDALNTDVEYHLTAIGGPNPNIYIADEAKENSFRIAGGVPGSKVSWQVLGVRQDAYAKAHPIENEVSKSGADRGRYLTPIEHGMSEDRGLPYSVAMKNAALRTTQEKRAVISKPAAPPKIPQPRPRK